MCVDKPSLVFDPDLDEVDKAERWLGDLLDNHRENQDGKVLIRNPKHLFGSLNEINKLLLDYNNSK